MPANAEIAFEGFIHPGDLIQEGPLGEWTGYYAGGTRPEPAIRIATFMHRDDPILLGAIPAVPPNDNTFYLGTYRCGAVWNQLEAAGVPEIKGVWAHEAGGSRFWLTVSIKQLYGGHAKQAGFVASQCHAGAYSNRWTIVVDDDIDPTNINDVIWAMCTRCDPREDVDIVRGCWSTHLDPMCYDGETDRRNARVVIDACKPFARRDTFPWSRVQAANSTPNQGEMGRAPAEAISGQWRSPASSKASAGQSTSLSVGPAGVTWPDRRSPRPTGFSLRRSGFAKSFAWISMLAKKLPGLEKLTTNFHEFIAVGLIADHHRHRNEVVERASGALQRCLNVAEGLAGLTRNIGDLFAVRCLSCRPFRRA